MTELKDLSPEQQEVVGSWGQSLAVMAGAGSGKTTTLVIKCAELLKRKPEARFAAVSFTERSASDLRAKLSERLSLDGEGGALSGHWVMTIHGLCGAIIREYPREAGFDGEEGMIAESEAQLLWERAVDALWQDDLPDEVRVAHEKLLRRESQAGLLNLLGRVKSLDSFGVREFLRVSGDPESGALEVIGRFVLDRYDRLKRRRGVLDFDDLEQGADRALENPSVREAYQRRFDLVLVDEFQDTNPTQAKIIRRFVRDDGSNLCVVGDPKQSIYRFRDADVTVFEDFCSKMTVRKSLTWNFRSRPGIIHYANDLCAQAFEASLMRYEALVPKRESDPELEPVLCLDVADPQGLAGWIQAEVARGIPLHEMALLVRRIRGNEKWFKALISSGIPIAIGSGGLFWDDPRVRELVSFLRWWDQPGNSLAGATFLRAPWVAIPDTTLDTWVKRDPTWQMPFFESPHPLARVLAPLRGKVVRPGELLLKLLVSEEIENELGAPLVGLWHRLEDLSMRGLDFKSVVNEITLAVENGRRERDVPPPKNQGQLSVLTLHGSKGLEFPHVVLIDLGKKGRAPDAPLLFWDRVQGAYLAQRTEDGERDKKNPIELRWREQEKAKNLAESKRLFYVALTRARERLVLVCPALEEVNSDPETAYTQDDWRGWVESCRAKITRIDGRVTEKRSFKAEPIDPRPHELRLRPPSVIRMKRPRHSVTEWNLLSRCPRAYEWTYVRPLQVTEGIEEIRVYSGVKVASASEEEISQKELGTRVHGLLEHGDFDGLRALESEVGSERFSAEPVVSWALSSPFMAPAQPSRGRDVWTEIAFEAPFGEEILVGSIDRLVQEADGDAYSIVDFKVTEKEKPAEELLEAYQTQLDLYAWALPAVEPRAKEATITASLVNISKDSVQVLDVAIRPFTKISDLGKQASRIIASASGEARPGGLCRMCEFRGKCPEGARFVQRSRLSLV